MSGSVVEPSVENNFGTPLDGVVPDTEVAIVADSSQPSTQTEVFSDL
jgi:hypothetical protein